MSSASKTVPLLTVGIATYNRPELLELILQSLVEQTYQNMEIIVADNCSPDPRVAPMVERFVALDPRIKYYRHDENKGSLFNFNFVQEMATGDFFMWASDDHTFQPDHMEKLMAIHQSGDYALVISDCDCLEPAGTVIPFKPIPSNIMSGSKAVALARFLGLHNWTYAKANWFYGIYRTDLAKKLTLSVEFAHLGADHIILYQIMSQGKVFFLDEKTWCRQFNYVYPKHDLEVDLTPKTFLYHFLNSIRIKRPPSYIEAQGYTNAIHHIIATYYRALPRYILHLVNECNKYRIMMIYCR